MKIDEKGEKVVSTTVTQLICISGRCQPLKISVLHGC